jgi:CheY-like chemotaxis protein
MTSAARSFSELGPGSEREAVMSLETILLLHNDTCIRSVVRAVLQQFGYEVLEAGSDAEATDIALSTTVNIDLLLTDTGAESAHHLERLRPNMKVVCMSSSKGPVQFHALRRRHAVLRKPFKPHLLARTIREVLDKPAEIASANFTCLLPNRITDLNPSHPYFTCRGITRDTVQHFGAGFFAGPGTLTGRIVIPIHSEGGDLIAYAGYSVDESEPKCKYWPEFDTSQVLFNYKPARCLVTEHAISVIVVDGLLDCMKVHQAGFPSVVSLIEPPLSEMQEELLTENFYLIMLLLNGSRLTRKIAPRLMKKAFVRVLADVAGRLPGSLSPEEIGGLMCDAT